MDFDLCGRYLCCRINMKCCGCCYNRMENSVKKEWERGPKPQADAAQPLNDVEREIIMADIAYLKQQDIESGARAKWEADQEKWSWYKPLRAINALVMRNSPFSIIDFSVEVPPVTEEQFTMATGSAPERDDMERVNCSDAGKPGHHFCGWCPVHNKPRWLCHH